MNAWKKRLDDEAVSPVIAVILMVAITVVLAAVLYVTVQQMAETNTSITPTGSIQSTESSTNPGNYTINLISLSDTVSYKDVYITITLSDGTPIYVGSSTAGMESLVGDGVDASSVTGANDTSSKYTKVTGATSISSGDVLALRAISGSPWDGAVVKYIYIPTGSQMAFKTL